jgi:hypothetical protein
MTKKPQFDAKYRLLRYRWLMVDIGEFFALTLAFTLYVMGKNYTWAVVLFVIWSLGEFSVRSDAKKLGVLE